MDFILITRRTNIMGFKGTLGWRLKTKKVSLPLMRSLYDLLANKLIETAKSSEAFNQGLLDSIQRYGLLRRAS